MNILVINWQDWKNNFAGGAEVYLYEIFSRLARKGHKIVLLCSRGEYQSRYEVLDGLQVYRIGKRNTFNFIAPFAMRAILRHNNIDIVIDDLNKIPFYSHFFTRKKTLAMLMHLFRHAIFKETNFVFALYVFLTERLIPYFYRRSSFVAISSSTAGDLAEIGIRNRITVVHSGIPGMQALPDEPREKNLVVYVGRVKMYKSIDHFVIAVSRIQTTRKIKALIVGDGDAREHLVQLAAQTHAEITCTGFVSEAEKASIYSRCRVVVQPSIKEGWGLTAIEAQAYGTPVVCADSPGLREVVRHGETGYLYKYGNIDELSARIIELLNDDAKWQKFSAAAKQWASSFSWDKSAKTLEKIILQEAASR